MRRDHRLAAILCAVGAAVCYALNVPVSKLLLARVGPRFMAALLYLGAGVGVGAMKLIGGRHEKAGKLTRKDLPYTLGMIALDIAAPILLMLGIRAGSSANAALLGNFEIVATTLIALLVFHEAVSRRLWLAIALVAVASAMLSFEGADSLHFSRGSLLVLGATACWGLENNCTKMLSDKSTYEIVILKGVFSGGGALLIALAAGEAPPSAGDAALAMLLGFVAYGLSIFMYIQAQRALGAAKTSAYYAIAPFVGAFLAFALVGEALTSMYVGALAVMAAGTALVVADTFARRHSHVHVHTIVHTHDGSTHTHEIRHAHDHDHYVTDGRHAHRHTARELRRELAKAGHA